MIDKKEYEKLQVYVPFWIFGGFILIFIFLGKDGCNDKMFHSNMRKWKAKFKANEIEEVSIVTKGEYYVCKGDVLNRHWKKVKKVYVNNQEIQPSKLYKKEDFMYLHCNENYTLLTNKEIDSIVYKFPPINQYEEYVNGKLINKSEEFSSKRKTHKKYNTSLPRCKE